MFHYLFRQKDAHIAHDFLPLPKEQGVRDRVIAAFDTLYTYNIELWKKQEVQRGNKDAKEVKVVTNADLELERAQEQAVLENNLRAISLRHKSDPVSQQFAITSYVHEHPSEFLAWAGIERDYSVDVREQAIAVLHHDPIVFARADATGRVLLAAGVSDWNIPIGDVSYFREHWDLHYKPGLSIDQILSLPPCPCTKDQIERIMREAPGLWNRDTPIILGYLSALFLHGGPYGYRSMPVGEAGQQCVYKWNGKLDETSTPDSVSPIIDSVRHLYDDVVPWFSLSHEEYYKRWIPNHQDNCSDIPPSKR